MNEEERTCDACSAAFTTLRSYKRHLKTDAHRKTVGEPLLARLFVCEVCGNGFAREYDKARHITLERCRGPAQHDRPGPSIPTKRAYEEIDGDDSDNGLQHGRLAASDEHHEVLGHIPSFHAISVAGPIDWQNSEDEPGLVEQLDWHSYVTYDDGTGCLGDTMDLDFYGEAPDLIPDNKSEHQPNTTEDGLSLRSTSAGSLEHMPQIHRQSSEDAVSVRSSLSLKRIFDYPLGPVKLATSHKPLSNKPALNVVGGKCIVCKEPFERDFMKLRDHLNRHLAEQKLDFVCDLCNIPFASSKDLRYHQQRADSGHCGFSFEHDCPCTGHHPVEGGLTKWSDHDRLKIEILDWQQAQLDAVICNVDRVLQLREVTARMSSRSCSKLPSAVSELLRRYRLSTAGSIASAWSGLKSFQSEPYDVDPTASNPIHDIAARFARLGIDGSSPRSSPAVRSPGSWNALRQRSSARQTTLSPERFKPILSDALANETARGDYMRVWQLLQNGGCFIIGALAISAAQGPVEMLQLLLSEDKDKLLLQRYGSVLLRLAVMGDQASCVQVLLDNGVDPDHNTMEEEYSDMDKVICLRGTRSSDRPGSVQATLSAAQKFHQGIGGNTYRLAACREDPQVLDVLARHCSLYCSANCHHKGGTMFSAIIDRDSVALRRVLQNGVHPDRYVARVCLNPGKSNGLQILESRRLAADECLTDSTFWFPIHLVAWLGYPELLDSLIANNAYVNMLTADNVSALHLATRQCHHMLVTRLCNAGAFVSGGILHEAAVCRKSLGPSGVRKAAEICSLLLKSGADLDEVDEEGRSPLELAISEGNVELARLILDARPLSTPAVTGS